MPPTLHLICGLPGAGKTTLAKALEARGGIIRLTPDEWMEALGYGLYDEAARERVETLQWTLAQRLLTAGVSVVLDNGFWSREERDRYRGGAVDAGAAFQLHFLDVPVDELKRRIAARNAERGVLAQIDPADVERWLALFEVPDAEETR